jgi:hypothetical protein
LNPRYIESLVICHFFHDQNNFKVNIDLTSHSRMFYLYGDITIASEGLQNLGLISLALRAFEQGRIFIVPHLL